MKAAHAFFASILALTLLVGCRRHRTTLAAHARRAAPRADLAPPFADRGPVNVPRCRLDASTESMADALRTRMYRGEQGDLARGPSSDGDLIERFDVLQSPTPDAVARIHEAFMRGDLRRLSVWSDLVARGSITPSTSTTAPDSAHRRAFEAIVRRPAPERDEFLTFVAHAIPRASGLADPLAALSGAPPCDATCRATLLTLIPPAPAVSTMPVEFPNADVVRLLAAMRVIEAIPALLAWVAAERRVDSYTDDTGTHLHFLDEGAFDATLIALVALARTGGEPVRRRVREGLLAVCDDAVQRGEAYWNWDRSVWRHAGRVRSAAAQEHEGDAASDAGPDIQRVQIGSDSLWVRLNAADVSKRPWIAAAVAAIDGSVDGRRQLLGRNPERPDVAWRIPGGFEHAVLVPSDRSWLCDATRCIDTSTGNGTASFPWDDRAWWLEEWGVFSRHEIVLVFGPRGRSGPGRLVVIDPSRGDVVRSVSVDTDGLGDSNDPRLVKTNRGYAVATYNRMVLFDASVGVVRSVPIPEGARAWIAQDGNAVVWNSGLQWYGDPWNAPRAVDLMGEDFVDVVGGSQLVVATHAHVFALDGSGAARWRYDAPTSNFTVRSCGTGVCLFTPDLIALDASGAVLGRLSAPAQGAFEPFAFDGRSAVTETGDSLDREVAVFDVRGRQLASFPHVPTPGHVLQLAPAGAIVDQYDDGRLSIMLLPVAVR